MNYASGIADRPRGVMASISNNVWSAVVDAEDVFGEGAEGHARTQAEIARAKGDMGIAEIWDEAADTLNALHSINRRRARPHVKSHGPMA